MILKFYFSSSLLDELSTLGEDVLEVEELFKHPVRLVIIETKSGNFLGPEEIRFDVHNGFSYYLLEVVSDVGWFSPEYNYGYVGSDS